MGKLKNAIKKIPFAQGMYDYAKDRMNYKDYAKDKKFYKNNYMYSSGTTKEKLEYSMLFEIHKLEKGFTVVDNVRPFGFEKIKTIIKNLETYIKMNYPKSFAYNLACSVLEEYKSFYEKNSWQDREEYKFVVSFLSNNELEYDLIPVGAYSISKTDLINDSKVDYYNFLKSRRSVRNFSSIELKDEDVQKAVSMASLTPTACNRQMCKIYYIKSDEAKKVVRKYAQGLSLFDLTNVNYFIITFDVSANYFVGERNQGWFNSGLVTMNFVNALHSLGIGSCCIQFGNSFKEETELKKLLSIPNSERIGVILTAGYYADESRIPYSTRKPIDEIYRER